MLTISDAILQARQLVQDTEVPYRNTEDKLYAYFTNGMATALRLRADLFIKTLEDPFIVYTVADADTEFPIDPTYFPPLVEFVAGFVAMEDDEFVDSNRAVVLQQMLSIALVGKPTRAGLV